MVSTAPEVDIGWRQIVDALVVAQVIVVGDEGFDLSLELAGQIVVLQQDAVLERQMPALDLSLCHRMIGRAAEMTERPVPSSHVVNSTET